MNGKVQHVTSAGAVITSLAAGHCTEQDGMETPDSERTTGSRMAEEQGGQASVGRQHARGAAQGDVEVPQRQHDDEVGGVQGIYRNSENVDNNLNKAAEAAGTSSSIRRENISDAGPSSPNGGGGGEVAIRIDDEDTNYGLDEGRRSGAAEGGGAGAHEESLLHEGDPPRPQQQQQGADDDRSLQEGNATGAADTTAVQQFRSSAPSFAVPSRFPLVRDKSGEHFIDIPLRTSSKAEELDAFKRFGIVRTLSNFSRASVESAGGDQCR